MIMYDRRTLLDIGQCYTNLIQNTLSTDPAWPLEILRSTELNNDHLNNRRRRRKHRGRRAGIRNRLRKRAYSPPLSLYTINGVTPGISPFCRVPVRLIWSISPLSAAPSICPGNLHRSSCLPFIFLHKQTLAWLCPISTMKSADMSTNIPTLLVSSLGTLTRPTSRKSCRTFINTYPVQPED